MREMLDEFKEKPKVSEEAEDRLETALLTKKERRAKNKAKFKERLAEMSGMEKFKYLVEYYKWYLIITAGLLLFLGSLSYVIYKNTRPLIISAAILNPVDPTEVNDKPFFDFAEANDIKKGHQLVSDIYSQVTIEEQVNRRSDSTSHANALTMKSTDDYYDIIITDQRGMEYITLLGVIYTLDSTLDEDNYNSLRDRFYYSSDYTEPSIATKALDSTTTDALRKLGPQDIPVGIDISDTAFAKGLNVGYEKIYLCVAGGKSENRKRVNMLLKYIFK